MFNGTTRQLVNESGRRKCDQELPANSDIREGARLPKYVHFLHKRSPDEMSLMDGCSLALPMAAVSECDFRDSKASTS